MGSGCSRVSRVRKKIPRNIVFKQSLKSLENGMNSSQDSKEDQESKEEEDDELDALSPTSKLAPEEIRTVSAASTVTVLPGTSISISPVMEELSDLGSFKPLPELTIYPDTVRNLLMGRCSSHKTNDSKSLKEVDLLALVGGPESFCFLEESKEPLLNVLKEFCFEIGITLNSLVFGYPKVPSGNGYRFLIINFIKKLLKSKRLIILVISGQEYTEIQPPEVIKQSDFDLAVRRMPSIDNRELVHCSYLADVNDTSPCYRLQKNNSDSSESKPLNEEEIIAILKSAFNEKQIECYITSVFEDILQLLQDSEDADLMKRIFMIHIEMPTETNQNPFQNSQRLQRLILKLEEKLPDQNCCHFVKGIEWQELWNGENESKESGAYSNLLAKIKEIILSANKDSGTRYFSKIAGKGIDQQLFDELIQQENEMRSHLKSFQDRPDLLSSVMNYVAGPQNHALVVHGRQGRGKSALLAVAAVLSGAVFPNMPIILRSVGVSTESFTQERVLRSVCQQIAALYGKHPSLASRSIAEHNSFFANLLKRACSERPLLIILDGLDQVEEYSGRSLKWFPTILPQHVKLILALRDGSNELQEIQERLADDVSAFLEIPDLDADDTLSIIEHHMLSRGRRLTDAQISFTRICVTDNSYPRYAHVFAHVACSWQTLSIPEHFWARHSLYDVIADYISHFSGTLGIKSLELLMLNLATFKHGVMKSEVFDMLETEISSAFEQCLAFIYLKHHLTPLLRTFNRKGHAFTHFRCQIFRKLFRTYLGKDRLHACLQRTLDYVQGNKEMASDDARPATEIKTNYKHQRWRELEESTHLKIKLNISVRNDFFNCKWLLERVTYGDPYLLLEEIKLYKRKNPDDREIDVLRKFLQLSSYSLMLDYRQLCTQITGRSQGFFLERERHIKFPTVKLWVKSVSNSTPYFQVRGPCFRTLADLQKVFPPSSKDSDCLDYVTWLNSEEVYLVTYSSSKTELEAWNASLMKKMASVKEVECIDGILTLGRNAEIVVLKHSRIEIVDLARGIVKTQMKELIDVSQGVKVVDGGKSILALSEGHEEILRFDTNSGHVGSRIFSGEHRQLHCLLVSDNGEVCVCGDTFQKPYPLLIWSVQTGVLLRQISLPHHEFLTRNSKINYDGRLLFALSKDLLTPSTSFLSTYDTTTGCIMWDVKPDSNITAIGLCQESERVIVTTERGDIYGWDMFTGEEGFSIFDPSCYVSRIETAVNKTFLTWDSMSQDRSLKLWDTTTGACIATFIADFNIYDCALSHEGYDIAILMCNKCTPVILSLKGVSRLKHTTASD
nr:uncharacterized protein LOC107452393 [Parasteatoda tepidariorum]